MGINLITINYKLHEHKVCETNNASYVMIKVSNYLSGSIDILSNSNTNMRCFINKNSFVSLNI